MISPTKETGIVVVGYIRYYYHYAPAFIVYMFKKKKKKEKKDKKFRLSMSRLARKSKHGICK
jgi:hypothetical protein